MPCGHQRSVASSSSFHRKPHSTAVPGTRARSACAVEVVEHAGDAHAAAEALDGGVDVGHVLVGTPQVDARRRVRGSPVQRRPRRYAPRLAACVRWWVSRSSSSGRVLAARRAHPPALAGLWELPGGKVEPGEDPGSRACARSARSSAARSRSPAGSTGPRRSTTTLVSSGSPPPAWPAATRCPREHDAVRWLRADQLDEVTWAEADVPFLDPLRDLLGRTALMRGVFFDEDHARAVVARLLARRLRRHLRARAASPARTTTRTTRGSSQPMRRW